MEIRKGSVVLSGFGPGVVTDINTLAGECLVKLDSGSVLDTTHGQWVGSGTLTVTGFDPEALVWWAGRQVPASDL